MKFYRITETARGAEFTLVHVDLAGKVTELPYVTMRGAVATRLVAGALESKGYREDALIEV